MIITFLGTKGGTGTTTMAVNCATAVHRLSRRPTLLMDVKPGPGDVAAFLGLRPRYSIVDLLDHAGWTDAVEARRFVAEHESGVHVLAGPETFGRPTAADGEAVEAALNSFRHMYEVIVVDAGSLLTTSSVGVCLAADVLMLVANPDVPCLRNVRRLCDALRVEGVLPERIRILLNRASDYAVMPVAQIEKVLERSIDFQVASDYRTVAAALNGGVPVSSLRPTPLHQQVDAMARMLIGPELAA